MLLEALNHYALTKGDANAIITESTTLSWADIQQMTAQLTSYLEQLLGQSQIIGISIKDEVLHLICSLSLISLGKCQITLPSYEVAGYKAKVAKQTHVTLCITDMEDLHLSDEGIPIVKICWSDFKHEKNSQDYFRSINIDETFLLLLTSGTTGNPKLIPVSQRQIYDQAIREKANLGCDPNNILWRPTSIEYNNSKRQRLYALILGTTNFFKTNYINSTLQTIIDKKITHLNISLSQARTILGECQKLNKRIPDGCSVRIGGSSVPTRVRNQILNEMTENLLTAYATSEFGPIATKRCTHDDQEGDVGLPYDMVKVQVVDCHNNILKYPEVGLLRLFSVNMVNHYFEDRIATQKNYKDGWFYPGDVGCYEPGGGIKILGREDEVINLASIKIFPEEIEKIYSSFLGVNDCAAFGIESNSFGRIPILAVEINIHFDKIKAMAYGKKNLGLRYPRDFLLVKKIPRNNAGKIDRKSLQAIYTDSINFL